MYNRHPALGPSWQPPLDIYETPDAYLIRIELPGVNTEEVQLDLSETLLTVAGVKRRPSEANSTRIHRLERGYGPFERRLQLPDDINPDAVEARLEQGVLTIRVGKRGPSAATRIPVQRRSEADT